MHLKIKLSSMEDIRNFVELVNQYPYEFDLKTNRQMVDAKSILGILSLDISKTLELHIHAPSFEKAKIETILESKFKIIHHLDNSLW